MSSGDRKTSLLLAVDAAINLLLGAVLVAVPAEAAAILGLPMPDSSFYARVLGGVLIGIGIALLLESRRDGSGLVGLGLAGAVAINLCGGLAVASWLVLAADGLPQRGLVFLWFLVAVLVVLSCAELIRAAGKRP